MNQIRVKHSGVVELKHIEDARDGMLCIMESQRDIPFAIQRVYFINQLFNGESIRGKHAHRTLSQVIFCISGSFTLSLDDGTTQQDIQMWEANVGVILGPKLWHTMHSFSCGCVILVLASDYFDEKDYIRDYSDFLKFIGKDSLC